MDFKDLLRLALRRWKTIAVCFALAVIAAALLSVSATPVYQSTSRVFISSTDVANSTDAYYASAFSSLRVKSYAELATSGSVLKQVADQLHLNLTPGELAGKVSAAVNADTVIIDIVAQDNNARVAQQIAQAEAELLKTYIPEVETPTGKATSPVKATIIDDAGFNPKPISPRTSLNLTVAGILGLLIGLTVAVLRDLLDNTIKTPKDIEATTDAAVMAHIAYDPSMSKTPLLTDINSHDPRNEGFRLLRTNLQFLNLENPPRSFVITSAVPGEGKTSTATNLAIALAQTGKRVLLVDGDLRRPQDARVLGLESSVGLTTVLVNRSELVDAIQHHDPSGIDFLASGPIPPNPTEILQVQPTRDLFDKLRDLYDVVVVDAPPLLPVADAALLATHCDGAILVIRHGRTTKEQLTQATGRLEQVGARLFGLLVNMTPRRSRSGYSYGYGYGYGYGYSPEETTVKAGKRVLGRRRA